MDQQNNSITLDNFIEILSKNKPKTKSTKSKEIIELPFSIEDEITFDIVENKDTKILTAPLKNENSIIEKEEKIIKKVTRNVPVLEDRFKGKNIIWI